MCARKRKIKIKRDKLNAAIADYMTLNTLLLEKNYQMQFGTDYETLHTLGQEILSLSEARNFLLQRIISMPKPKPKKKPNNGNTPIDNQECFLCKF